MLLEIAVFNISSAITAEKAGTNRIELCENPYDGGTTPSYGTLKTVRERISIPVFPIIRPRGGDFLYNDEEFEVMKKDIVLCKELGFKGAVTGLLHKDGSIDIERTKQLVGLAYPLQITFHRAFDRANAPLIALEDVIKTGCARILTSGQKPNVLDATALVKELVLQAKERIIILPGSGVRSNNIFQLAKETGVKEFHSSARKECASEMQYTVTAMNENLMNIQVDTEEVKRMKEVLNDL